MSLWRFDGDDEPIKLSRRRFFLFGAAAGTAIVAAPLLAQIPDPAPLTGMAWGSSDGLFSIPPEGIYMIKEAGPVRFFEDDGLSLGRAIGPTFARVHTKKEELYLLRQGFRRIKA